MTINLSFKRHNPMTKGIEAFYTDLHAMTVKRNRLEQPTVPTDAEFRRFLALQYPNGLGDMHCLDAGCGGTAFSARRLLNAKAAYVAAVDVNHGSLRRAAAAITSAGADGSVAFVTGSVLRLPFASDHFDFIVCSGVVHHTPDPQVALHELARVTRPGGVAYISVYCFERSLMLSLVRLWRLLAWLLPFRLMHRLFGWLPAVNNFVLDHMYVPILWVYRASDFERLLLTAGFDVFDSFRSTMDPFGTRDSLKHVISGDGLLRVFLCRRKRGTAG